MPLNSRSGNRASIICSFLERFFLPLAGDIVRKQGQEAVACVHVITKQVVFLFISEKHIWKHLWCVVSSMLLQSQVQNFMFHTEETQLPKAARLGEGIIFNAASSCVLAFSQQFLRLMRLKAYCCLMFQSCLPLPLFSPKICIWDLIFQNRAILY